MPEKQEPNRCQMHTTGKIPQKKTQLLRCGAPHNTFFFFIFFPPLKTDLLLSICLYRSHKTPGASPQHNQHFGSPARAPEAARWVLPTSRFACGHTISGNRPARCWATRERNNAPAAPAQPAQGNPRHGVLCLPELTPQQQGLHHCSVIQVLYIPVLEMGFAKVSKLHK